MSIITLVLIFSMLAVIWSDVTRYLIPNWLVGLLLLTYPVGVYLAPVPVDWKMALMGMLAMFAAGYIIFAMKWMGGGDIKLLIVCALWVGWGQNLIDYIILVAMLGGLFAVIVWVIRKTLPYLPKQPAKLPRILQEGAPMPYGVAIAVGFLVMMAQGHIPALVAGAGLQ